MDNRCLNRFSGLLKMAQAVLYQTEFIQRVGKTSQSLTLYFDTPQPKGVGILGLNLASTSNANFGLTVSYLVRLHLLQQALLWTTPQA